MQAYRTLVFFGDSLTERGHDPGNDGWLANLQHAYVRRSDIVNRGFSGYNTEWAQNVLPMLLPRAAPPLRRHASEYQPNGSRNNIRSGSSSRSLASATAAVAVASTSASAANSKENITSVPGVDDHPPVHTALARLDSIDLLAIFFGANDSVLSPNNQHVSLARYRENLRTLVNMVRSPMSPYYAPKTRILLITPPPIDEQKLGEVMRRNGMGPRDRTAAVTQRYAEACVRLALDLNLPVLDLHTLILNMTRPHVPLASAPAGGNSSGIATPIRRRWSAFLSSNSPFGQLIGRSLNGGSSNNSSANSSAMPSVATTPQPLPSLGDFLEDGLHLSALGNRTLYEGVMGVIRRVWPELDPTRMNTAMPLWGSLTSDREEARRVINEYCTGQSPLSAAIKGKQVQTVEAGKLESKNKKNGRSLFTLSSSKRSDMASKRSSAHSTETERAVALSAAQEAASVSR